MRLNSTSGGKNFPPTILNTQSGDGGDKVLDLIALNILQNSI